MSGHCFICVCFCREEGVWRRAGTDEGNSWRESRREDTDHGDRDERRDDRRDHEDRRDRDERRGERRERDRRDDRDQRGPPRDQDEGKKSMM